MQSTVTQGQQSKKQGRVKSRDRDLPPKQFAKGRSA